MVVLSLLVVFGGLLAVATRTWASAALASPVGGVTTLDVTGSQAAPVVTACALVGLAGAAALSISGRRTRPVVLAFCALAAIAAAVTAVGVLRDPLGATRAQVAQALVVTPDSVTTASVTNGFVDVSVTGWAWAGALVAALAALLALVGLTAAGSWSPSARFTAPASDPAGTAPPTAQAPVADDDPAASWDALTRGVDPTSGPVHRARADSSGRMDLPDHPDGGTRHV